MSVRATYRVQFHKDFTFADAERLVPYFAKLGISHLYASPILTARAGSAHGYDVIDHARINPELGGEDGFRALAAALRERGLGIVLDIVPNHMAVGGADNVYWLDVLEKGRDSVFAALFDIDWEPAHANLRDKVLVPFLGKPVDEALAAGDIALIWDAALGKFAFAYAEHRFPLRKEDYEDVLAGAAEPAEADLRRFQSPDALKGLLERQNFRLSFWRSAGDRINWRRFFDITGLAALRMEDDAVFEQVHATLFRLYAEELIDGVRVDHIDGLSDPRSYCRRLRARLEALLPQRQRRERPLIVVEKILAPGEQLPGDWDVDGTTGYDFMDQVSALQHDPAGAAPLSALWSAISGRPADFETEECTARREILFAGFGNALRATAAAFRALAEDEAPGQSATEAALGVLLEHFRAYRTYATGDNPLPAPGPQFEAAVERASAASTGEVLDAIRLVAGAMRGARARQAEAARDAVRHFNQLAAPIAAKAVEDTAFYRYGRLLSRNDVGFSPGCFSIGPDQFFAAAAQRAEGFPQSLLATATHDHKRGEDTRARLAALSEISGAWEREVRQWFALNAPLRDAALDPGDEYQLYQTLVGSWPIEETREPSTEYVERILAWREKSSREAKLRTSWSAPDPVFEKANADFVRAILDPQRAPVFLARLGKFVEALAPAGVCNSLVQCALRYTSPGVADLYQGCELWDFSLVDPDNRRPVDYERRQALLDRDAAPDGLLHGWRSGQVKLALIRRLLALRARIPQCFSSGALRPIEVIGAADLVVAFLREGSDGVVLVAVPRLCAEACIAQKIPLPDVAHWGDAALAADALPAHRKWKNALDPEMPIVDDLACRALFASFPVAVLFSD